jgi:hypothetical protein
VLTFIGAKDCRRRASIELPFIDTRHGEQAAMRNAI